MWLYLKVKCFLYFLNFKYVIVKNHIDVDRIVMVGGETDMVISDSDVSSSILAGVESSDAISNMMYQVEDDEDNDIDDLKSLSSLNDDKNGVPFKMDCVMIKPTNKSLTIAQ